MTLNLSVLILAKNEEHNIEDCIRSVSFAGEVVVIDDFSTDRTAALARGLGARIVTHAMNGNWGAQQTFAIGQAVYDWVYFLDADERVSPRLAECIKNIVMADDRRYAYLNGRLNYFWEQTLRHGGWFPDYGVHLLPKEGTCVTGFVHPRICHPYEERKLPLDAYLVHYPYRDWTHYLNKLNLYTTLAAQKRYEEGRRAHLSDMILRPFWASFRMYFLKRGFLDGRVGFILAVFHYFYTMAKYVKLYYLDKTNRHTGDVS